MAITIRPYKYFEHQITVSSVEADSNVDMEKEGVNRYSLHGSQVKAPFKLLISTELPIGWESLFTPAEMKKPPYEVIISYQSKDCRKKGLEHMTLVSGNKFEGSLALNFDDWRGRLNIVLKLIRTQGIVATQGFATHQYGSLADSEPFTVDFDERILETKGGELEIDWERFSSVKEREGALYYLDHETTYSLPKLKFNEDMTEELKAILLHKGGGEQGKKRNIVWAPTSSDIWEQIATITFGIVRDDNGTDLDSIPDPWDRIAKAIAGVIYPLCSQKDAEKELFDACNKDDDGNKVFRDLLDNKLPVAVQRKVELLNSLEEIS